MMLSPGNFIHEYKDADYPELMKVRDRLVKDILEFEKKEMAGDRSGEEWEYCPSPEVVYQMNLEYLSALCKLMQEKYNTEYVWGDKELGE